MVGLPCLVSHVARSWVEVGSFHTRLFGVVYVTCDDFHDGSEKGTASVQQRVDAFSGETQNGFHSPPTVLPWFGTLWLLPISKNEISLKDPGLIPLRKSRPNRRECLTFWQERVSRQCFKNGGDSVYMREGSTSRVMAGDRPYGESYEYYSVSPGYFGYNLVKWAVK
jgi:hypothetical protein